MTADRKAPNMLSKKAIKTAMGQASLLAGATEAGPFVPWFRDPDKLLAAVLARTEGNAEFKKRAVLALVDLVRDDLRLRKALETALKAPRRGPRGTPYLQHVLLLSEQHLLRVKHSYTREAAIEWLAKKWNVSEETIPRRLARAEGAVREADRWWLDKTNEASD